MLTPWRAIKTPPRIGTSCAIKVRHADGKITEHKGPFVYGGAGGWYRSKQPGAGRIVLGKVMQWRLA